MTNFTKQVGWSPSVPPTVPSVTVATDNGDGTGYITNPDGTVVPLVTSSTTYTFPSTVADDGVMVITGSDGSSQTVTIEYPEDVDVASNSVVGGVVQFVDSNGDPLPDLDIDLNPYISSPHPTIAAADDATVTFNSATNEWVIGFVDTDTDLVNQLTVNADGSITSQVVDVDGNPSGAPVVIPAPTALVSYTAGQPNTLAEVAAGASKAVDFGSTDFLTTNMASEIGASGVRNPNGALGYHAMVGTVVDVGGTTPVNMNGGWTRVINTVGDDTPVTIPSGIYVGQIMNLTCIGVNTCILEGTFWGIHLRRPNNTYPYTVSGEPQIRIRPYESMILVWGGGSWVVKSWEKRLYSSPVGYRENYDGSVTMNGSLFMNQSGVYVSLVLPTSLDGVITEGNTSVVVTDSYGAVSAAGDPITGAANARNTFIWTPDGSGSAVLIAAEPTEASYGVPFTISWHLETDLSLA